MKKVLAICLMIVMVVSMSVTSFAAPGGFVSSPSGNPAPTVVDFDPSNDNCTGWLVITPYGDKEDLSDVLRSLLEKAYNDIVNSDDLTKLNAELAKIAADKNIEGENLERNEFYEFLKCFHSFHISYRNGKENPKSGCKILSYGL